MSNFVNYDMVPNVPCGVESQNWDDARKRFTSCVFLMYRVELKVNNMAGLSSTPTGS